MSTPADYISLGILLGIAIGWVGHIIYGFKGKKRG